MCGALVWRSAVARATHKDTSGTELALVRHSSPMPRECVGDCGLQSDLELQRGLGTFAHCSQCTG